MKKIFPRLLNIVLVLLMVLLTIQAGTISSNAQIPENSFWIEYIDVGQGDAALIQCDGHYMMIDGGAPSASSTIYAILKSNNISNIDYMIATHPDEDHIGGLSGALNYATVKCCYCSVTEHNTKPFKSLVRYLKKQGISITVPQYGDVFTLGSAMIEILGPIYATEDSNDMSIIARITYGNTSFLFTGDAEEAEETDLIKKRVDFSCDVLKVSHHGSAHSTSASFLAKANPEYAVISVGADNSYGHPTLETLDRLNEKGIKLFRTDLQGDILCTSDGNTVSFTTEKSVTDFELWRAGDLGDTDIVVDRSVGGVTYVVNINTNKFHKPTCSSVSQMKEKNRRDVTCTRDELIDQGYSPCGNCHP